MGAGGLTSIIAAGPICPNETAKMHGMQLSADQALSARSLPELSPHKHLKGGSERVLPSHGRDIADAQRHLKSLSFRAPIFGKPSLEKVDAKINSKYCNDEIVKGWLKARDSTEEPGSTNGEFPGADSEEHRGDDLGSWNGIIRRTQSL